MATKNGISHWTTALIQQLTEYERKRTAFEEKRERIMRELAREEAELAKEESMMAHRARETLATRDTAHASSLRAASSYASFFPVNLRRGPAQHPDMTSSPVNRAAQRKRRRGSNHVVESSSSDDDDTTDNEFNTADDVPSVSTTAARMTVPRSTRTTSSTKNGGYHKSRNYFWEAMVTALSQLHRNFGFTRVDKASRKLPTFVLTYKGDEVECIEKASSLRTKVDSLPKLYIFLSKYRGLKDEVRRKVGPPLFEKYLSAGPKYETKDFEVVQEFDELERMTAACSSTKSRED